MNGTTFILLDNEKEEHEQYLLVSAKSPDFLDLPDDKFGDLAYEVRFDFTCNWEGAINFRPRTYATYGYLFFWSGCGGLSLSPDITVVNPFSSGGQSPEVVFDDEDGGTVLKCVGVIEKFQFRGLSKTDPIRIVAYVSKKSAANLHAKLSGAYLNRSRLKTDLEVSWYIISCEGAGEKWYEAAHVQGFQNALANIASDQGKDGVGGDLKVKVDRESPGLKGEGGEVDIRLYRFEFEIVPAPGETNQLHFETGHGEKVVREWGGST